MVKSTSLYNWEKLLNSTNKTIQPRLSSYIKKNARCPLYVKIIEYNQCAHLRIPNMANMDKIIKAQSLMERQILHVKLITILRSVWISNKTKVRGIREEVSKLKFADNNIR